VSLIIRSGWRIATSREYSHGSPQAWVDPLTDPASPPDRRPKSWHMASHQAREHMLLYNSHADGNAPRWALSLRREPAPTSRSCRPSGGAYATSRMGLTYSAAFQVSFAARRLTHGRDDRPAHAAPTRGGSTLSLRSPRIAHARRQPRAAHA